MIKLVKIRNKTIGEDFPVKLENNYLNFIKTLSRVFGLNIGCYNHLDGGSVLVKIIPMMAIGNGAQVLEKKFILTCEVNGIDYEYSLNPENFIEFSNLLWESEEVIGKKEIKKYQNITFKDFYVKIKFGLIKYVSINVVSFIKNTLKYRRSFYTRALLILIKVLAFFDEKNNLF